MSATPSTTTHRCVKCGRRMLKATFDGLGPKCRTKVRRATRSPELAAYGKPHLVAKAVELLEMGGLVLLRKSRKNRVYVAISSDGLTTYRTARAACTCPAGLKAVHLCAHRIAAHALDLAS
ncbi:SWIM zinc finger family protein [Streptomyces sp. ME02-6987-2C]|uniref:SWIM zinc finger family protein n=1 Tax=unclassified Streptomyces TaxID=2593676 RepID=UPI0029AABC73|nr:MULTISPECIES: SWIM zinc finger family protein [unclassified Streptomyces]MDX3345937.1 SWIM zinc finger family protein [Streptomyces sp. ME02-6979A]MDX3371987.1 SWIM zinc finger family protein [Streptomyces sp. ME02-6987-2C]MDX3412203.1 SWIM zinc finger family protein [Streptomyces sp. ME02-6977A]MDX3421703.1 SWIM zinc finger family protein [Streptomyces sp. ME02-6985-2c]